MTAIKMSLGCFINKNYKWGKIVREKIAFVNGKLLKLLSDSTAQVDSATIMSKQMKLQFPL